MISRTTSDDPRRPGAGAPERDDERALVEEILRALRQVRFGSVEIVVHDSKVVQIERREKFRFAGPASKEPR
jgi:hypothetical protein